MKFKNANLWFIKKSLLLFKRDEDDDNSKENLYGKKSEHERCTYLSRVMVLKLLVCLVEYVIVLCRPSVCKSVYCLLPSKACT